MAEEKRSSRLQPVAKLVEDKQQRAVRKLGESRQNLRQQQQQLRELESYRIEYMEQLQDTARNGISSARLRHYQSFVSKLSEAIEQQQKVVLIAEQSVDGALNDWFQVRNRARVIGTVISACREEELREVLRSEQKESDERTRQRSGD